MHSDGETGELLWESSDWNLMEGEVKDVYFPRRLLSCAEVSREITFSSKEVIKDFQLLQRIKVHG